MAVSFNSIPSDIRVPLFHCEIDNSAAGTFEQKYRALLIGQSLKIESVDIPFFAISQKQIEDIAGRGSMLASMHKAFRRNNSFMEVWCLPVYEADEAVYAQAKITVSGSACAAGVLHFYIAGMYMPVSIKKDQTGEQIASEIANTVNSNNDLPISAVTDEKGVVLSCKWKGMSGNDINIQLNYYGDAAGEFIPAGVAIDVIPMSGGMQNPDILPAVSNLSDEEFDFIVLPYTDKGNLDKISEFMNDITGRWSWSKQIFGHVFASISTTTPEAITIGRRLNDPHLTVMPVYNSPTPPWETASILTAVSASSLSIDPARPLQTLPLTGIMPAGIKDRPDLMERNTLLYNGMSTYSIQSGTCLIERVITTYQSNAYGVRDNSYLDVETLYTSAYIIRAMRQRITQKYGRHKLASDGARFAPGQAIVTPKTIKAELIALYSELEYAGIVENAEMFEKHLMVERDQNNVNRINVLFPPDYVNQLRIFAVVNQFG